MHYRYFYKDNKYYLTGIEISHFTIQEAQHRWDNKTPMIRFVIDFEPPYTDKWATEHYAPSFNTERERALYIKDKIVKDIRVYMFNPQKTPPHHHRLHVLLQNQTQLHSINAQ